MKYGSRIAPVNAGAAITPSRNSFAFRTVMPGAARDCAFVILFRKCDHARDGSLRSIASFSRRDFRGKVCPRGQASGAAYGRERCHVFGRRGGIEKAGDALLVSWP